MKLYMFMEAEIYPRICRHAKNCEPVTLIFHWPQWVQASHLPRAMRSNFTIVSSVCISAVAQWSSWGCSLKSSFQSSSLLSTMASIDQTIADNDMVVFLVHQWSCSVFWKHGVLTMCWLFLVCFDNSVNNKVGLHKQSFNNKSSDCVHKQQETRNNRCYVFMYWNMLVGALRWSSRAPRAPTAWRRGNLKTIVRTKRGTTTSDCF
jgi:hypothetical protein